MEVSPDPAVVHWDLESWDLESWDLESADPDWLSSARESPEVEAVLRATGGCNSDASEFIRRHFRKALDSTRGPSSVKPQLNAKRSQTAR